MSASVIVRICRALDVGQHLRAAARPAHLDAIGARRRAETEVQPQIVVRVVARLAQHRARLPRPPAVTTTVAPIAERFDARAFELDLIQPLPPA